MKHPHPGRMAEVYHQSPPDKYGGVLLKWAGYTAGPDYADHPKHAEWSDLLKAWIVQQVPKKRTKG